MANICENRIIIYATSEEFDEILNLSEHDIESADVGDEVFLDKDVFSLKKYIPNPENEGSVLTDKQQAWRLDNWGVKWDLDEVKLLEYDEDVCDDKLMKKAIISFETPWNAPGVGITEISKIFPNVEFSLFYKEENMRLVGLDIIKNGEREELKFNYDDVFDFNAILLFEKIRLNHDNNIEFNITFDQRKDMEDYRNAERDFLNVKITIKKEDIANIINTKSINIDSLILGYNKDKLFDFAFNNQVFMENDFYELIKDKIMDNIDDLVKIFDYLILTKVLPCDNKKTNTVKI